MDGRDDYDRLAWGLVREEIRNLHRHRDSQDAELILFKRLASKTQNPFRQGFLDPREVGEVRAQLLEDLRSSLGLFRLGDFRGRLDAGSAITEITDGLFWELKDIELDHDDRSSHGEKMASLHGLTLSMGRRSLVADLASAAIKVNQHSLYRMIQRGLVEREPLAHLSHTIDEWLPYAAMMLLAHRSSPEYLGGQTIIPMGGGAMLAHLRIMPASDLDIAHKGSPEGPRGFRVHQSIHGPSLSSLPYKSFVEGQTSQGEMVTLNLLMSTWIPEAFFHSQQWWVVMRLRELREKYDHQFRSASAMLHSHARNAHMIKDEVVEESISFREEIERLMANPKWGIACNWARHAGG